MGHVSDTNLNTIDCVDDDDEDYDGDDGRPHSSDATNIHMFREACGPDVMMFVC